MLDPSTRRLRLGKFPCAIEDAGSRQKEAHRVVPLLCDRQAILNCHHLCRRALDGEVVTELPPFLAAAPIREKRLVRLLPQYPLPEWSINLIYPPHRHPSTIVRTYLDFCQSYLPKIVQACKIGAGI